MAVEPGGVRQQVVDRDRPLRRHQAMLGRLFPGHEPGADVSVRRLLEHGDLHPSELRQVGGDLVGRMQQPLLDQHHRCHAEHGLGRGGHAKDRVLLHGPPTLDVHQAVRLEVNNLPPPRHRRDRPPGSLPSRCGAASRRRSGPGARSTSPPAPGEPRASPRREGPSQRALQPPPGGRFLRTGRARSSGLHRSLLRAHEGLRGLADRGNREVPAGCLMRQVAARRAIDLSGNVLLVVGKGLDGIDRRELIAVQRHRGA